MLTESYVHGPIILFVFFWGLSVSKWVLYNPKMWLKTIRTQDSVESATILRCDEQVLRPLSLSLALTLSPAFSLSLLDGSLCRCVGA